MKLLPSGDSYELSSGKIVYANEGILGLAPGSNDLFEGYDGWLADRNDPLTAEEKVEIADFMIAMWQKYREAAHAKGE